MEGKDYYKSEELEHKIAVCDEKIAAAIESQAWHEKRKADIEAELIRRESLA
jgi:hypothetical protein